MITFKNVTKKRGRMYLDIPSLTLESGRLILIVGGNGNGKTTLIKLLSGGLTPDQGSISIENQSMQTYVTQHGISYVPSTFPFSPSISLWMLGQVGYSLIPTWDSKVYKDQLKQLGLEDTNRVDEISKGQKNMCMFNVVMQQSTEILLLDEPTLGLDGHHRDVMIATIQDFLINPQHTAIVATNALEHFEAIADEVILISKGKCIIHDSVEAIKDRYQLVFKHDVKASIPDKAIVSILESENFLIDTHIYSQERIQRLSLIHILKALVDAYESLS